MHKGTIPYIEAVREFRKAFIATVLRENNGNQSKAAQELGMHRNTLTRTASALELDVRAFAPVCADHREERPLCLRSGRCPVKPKRAVPRHFAAW